MGLTKKEAEKRIKKDTYTYDDYSKWEEDGDWEIVGGKAYAMAPSPTKGHQSIAGNIYSEIKYFLKGKPCQVFYELDVILSKENIVRPDIFIVCDKEKLKEAGCFGTPDVIIEILSPSTARYDKTIKLELYKKYGVKEYWIVDPVYKEITVYSFSEEKEAIYSFYEKEEQSVEVGIFKGELKIELRNIFAE